MASVVQKYFIVSGMVTRSSSHRRKKWSIAVRAVKINGSVLGYGYFLLSEFFGGQTFYFDKRTKKRYLHHIFLQYRSREIFRNSAWAEKQEFS